MAIAPRPRCISARKRSRPTTTVVRSRMAASRRGSQSISKTMRPRWWNIARVVALRYRGVQSGNAWSRLRSAILRSRRTTCHPICPTTTPRRARTSARSLATLRLELFDDGRPFAARAQQPLDRLAERPLAAARVELPRRRSEHLGCRIGRRRRDRRAQHRREVGEVIAEVKNLLESNAKLFGYALALGQLVRRPLVQLANPRLSRPPHQRRRATARDQHDRAPRLLRQLRPEAITNVEVLDLPLLATVY